MFERHEILLPGGLLRGNGLYKQRCKTGDEEAEDPHRNDVRSQSRKGILSV